MVHVPWATPGRSPDAMRWRFTLREGLAFHDGTPVRAADAVASIRRWAQRDVVGKALAAATGALEVVDDRSFSLTLARPFALVTQALARPTASALFVMPERLAATPAATAITDATGSGPFIFQANEWRAGDRAVYRRNPAYRPRPEPADGLAGGKVAKIDRLEWLAMPDPATAAAALQAGEVDFVEAPSPDLIPTLERNPISGSRAEPDGRGLAADQPHAAALQRPAGAAGAALPGEPAGEPRGRRHPPERAGALLPGLFPLRHAAGKRRRGRGPARPPSPERPGAAARSRL